MKRILIILFYFFVSFELTSLDLNLVCEQQRYWHKNKYEEVIYNRSDYSDPTSGDGFFILKGKNIRSNLLNLSGLDPIETLNVKETDIFILVRQYQKDGYFEIRIDRYTGAMKTSLFKEKSDSLGAVQIINYICSKGKQKF